MLLDSIMLPMAIQYSSAPSLGVDVRDVRGVGRWLATENFYVIPVRSMAHRLGAVAQTQEPSKKIV